MGRIGLLPGVAEMWAEGGLMIVVRQGDDADLMTDLLCIPCNYQTRAMSSSRSEVDRQRIPGEGSKADKLVERGA